MHFRHDDNATEIGPRTRSGQPDTWYRASPSAHPLVLPHDDRLVILVVRDMRVNCVVGRRSRPPDSLIRKSAWLVVEWPLADARAANPPQTTQ